MKFLSLLKGIGIFLLIGTWLFVLIFSHTISQALEKSNLNQSSQNQTILNNYYNTTISDEQLSEINRQIESLNTTINILFNQTRNLRKELKDLENEVSYKDGADISETEIEQRGIAKEETNETGGSLFR